LNHPGTGGQLVITGSASLGGTLNVSLLNGFVPTTGSTFPVLTFASRSGSFATITGLAQGGVQFGTQYNSTNFTLVVMASRQSEEDEVGGEEGVPDRPRLPAGEAVAAAPSEEEPEAAGWWPEGLAGGSVFALQPEDLFFVQVADNVVPRESMAAALAGNSTPSDDAWQELLNLLAGLFNLLFGLG
jgi:hypothetical protein